jgi:hypothetical protein
MLSSVKIIKEAQKQITELYNCRCLIYDAILVMKIFEKVDIMSSQNFVLEILI